MRQVFPRSSTERALVLGIEALLRGMEDSPAPYCGQVEAKIHGVDVRYCPFRGWSVRGVGASVSWEAPTRLVRRVATAIWAARVRPRMMRRVLDSGGRPPRERLPDVEV